MLRVSILFLLIFISRFGFAKIFHATHGGVYTHSSLILQLKTTKDGQSSYARAKQIALKLNAIKAPQLVRVEFDKDQAKIMIGKTSLVRVNAAEAKAHHQNIKILALSWAKKLRRVCSASPRIQLKKKNPIPASEKSSDLSYLFVFEKKKQDVLPGPKAVAAINDSNIQISPKIQIEVELTGSPATPINIEKAVYQSIKSKLKPVFLNRVEVTLDKLQPMQMGQSCNMQARLKVTHDAKVEAGVIDILIKNKALAFHPEHALWYSNEPENIKAPSLLGMSELKVKSPLRILSHHINASSYPLGVQVMARNLSLKIAKIVVTRGEGMPHTDPVRVGLEAGHKFMRSWISQQGEIIEVQPGGAVPVFMKKLWPRQTMSGLARLELLEGGPHQLLLTEEAILLSGPSEPFLVQSVSRSIPQRPQLSKHIFQKPFQLIQANYVHGGRFEFVQIGANPLPNTDGSEKLEGNFGVIYHIQANISNPTPKQAEIEVVFEASAGYSGAIFVVDGKLVRPQLLQSKKEYLISKVQLAPGTKKSFRMITIPLSGSSYPAMITIRPKGGR